MIYSITRALPFLLLFSAVNPVFGQLSNKKSDGSEVVTRIYKSEVVQSPDGVAQENDYNPWTIHKKVARYGLAGSMAATFVGSLAMDDVFFETTIIPVVGPFVTMVRIENDPTVYYRPGSKPLLIASGITQSAFLTYLVVAWIGETSYEARNRSNLSVMPTGGRAGAGIALQYQF